MSGEIERPPDMEEDGDSYHTRRKGQTQVTGTDVFEEEEIRERGKNIWQNTSFAEDEPPAPGILGTFGGSFGG